MDVRPKGLKIEKCVGIYSTKCTAAFWDIDRDQMLIVSATGQAQEQGCGGDKGDDAEPLPAHQRLLESKQLNARIRGWANLVKSGTKSNH
jgi:hypothetical protein